MSPKTILELAGRLMRHPAAPYHEHAVRAEVEGICTENGLDFRRDVFGNLLVRFKRGAAGRSVVLAAHLDHPGFEVVRRLAPTHWLARFQGGVPDKYFRPGTRVRLMPGALPASLMRRRGKGRNFELKLLPHTAKTRASLRLSRLRSSA